MLDSSAIDWVIKEFYLPALKKQIEKQVGHWKKFPNLRNVYRRIPRAIRQQIAIAVRLAGTIEASKVYPFQRIMAVYLYYPGLLPNGGPVKDMVILNTRAMFAHFHYPPFSAKELHQIDKKC